MVVETDKIRVNPSYGRDRGIRTLTPKHRYLKPACLPKLHHIPIWWTLRESNPSVFLFAKQVTTPCSPKAHCYYLENFIKRTLPVFILYSYNAAHHSVTVTIGLSPRAVALKLPTASPKTPSTEGNLSTPNFHPSFRIWITLNIFYSKKPDLSLGLLVPPSGFLSISEKVIGSTPLFCIPCIYSHLADVVCRVLPIWASIVGATSLGVPLLTLHLCHYFFIGGWYTTCPYPLSVQRSLPLWGIPLTKTRQFHSAHAELIRLSF